MVRIVASMRPSVRCTGRAFVKYRSMRWLKMSVVPQATWYAGRLKASSGLRIEKTG